MVDAPQSTNSGPIFSEPCVDGRHALRIRSWFGRRRRRHRIGVTFEPVGQTWRLAQQAPLEPLRPSEGTDASQKAVRVESEVYIWTGWVGTDWEELITRVVAYDPS